MAKMFARGHRFFAVPSILVYADSLSAQQLRLYLWLLAEVQRKGRNRLLLSNKELAAAVGGHATNAGDLRTALCDAGFLHADKTKDGFVYSVMDPDTRSRIDEPAKEADDDYPQYEDTGAVPDDAEVEV